MGIINDYLDNPVLLRDWIARLGRIYDMRCHGSEYTDSSGEDASQEPLSITYDQAGVPTMIYEVCVSLLEAGFLPKTSRFLREKMKQVLINACEKLSTKTHISVPKSATLICIADDLGILEENEVSIRFGKPFRDEETGRNKFYITGDVLVARVGEAIFYVLTGESSKLAFRHTKGACCGTARIGKPHGCHCVFHKRGAKYGIASLRW